MLRISIWNGYCLQHLTVTETDWSLTGPTPPSAVRLIGRATGKVSKVAAASTGTFDYVLTGINHKEEGISLGYHAAAELPTSTPDWRTAWLLSADAVQARTRGKVFQFGGSKLAYKTTTIIDPSHIWLGVFAVASVSAGIMRAKKTLGFVWPLKYDGKMYFLDGDCGSLCWGLGPSAGVGVGILSGFEKASDIAGFTQFEGGATVTAGAAGKGQVKALNALRTVTKNTHLLAQLQPAIKVIQAAEGQLKGVASSSMKWEALKRIYDAKGTADSHLKALQIASNFAKEAGTFQRRQSRDKQ